jgi:cell division septal protein FtsQ
LSQDVRFRRSTKNISRSKARKRRGFWAIVIFSVSFLAIAATAAWFGFKYLNESDRFVARELVINNTEFADLEQIRTTVLAAIGQNMFSTDLDAVSQAVETLPWILSASTQKELPDILHLDIIEDQPIALCQLGRTLFLVDKEGMIIDRLKQEHPFLELPIITGLNTMDEEERAAALIKGTRLLHQIQFQHGQWYNKLGELDLSEMPIMRMWITDCAGPVILSEKRFVSGLTKYFNIEATLNERYDALEYIDVRFDRRVVVKSGD